LTRHQRRNPSTTGLIKNYAKTSRACRLPII
jgi:hypothetical protein